jgi:hypothetical protein
LRGAAAAAIVASISSVLLFRSSGETFARSVVTLFPLLSALFAIVVGLQSLFEPMLIVREDGIVVRKWGARRLRLGGRKFPPQELNPEEVPLRGRGGRTRVVQLSLWDGSGGVHKIRFFFIKLADFQSALDRIG